MTKHTEAAYVDQAATGGKFRFTRERKKALGYREELVNGITRFKITGLYMAGQRVRRFFPTESEAKTFIEVQQLRADNIGALAKNIDGRMAHDAAECATMLKPHDARLLDVVREWVAARGILKAFPQATITESATHFAQVLAERHSSWTVEEGALEWLDSLERKRRSPRYKHDATQRLVRLRSLYGTRNMADITPELVQAWLKGLGTLGPQSQKNYLTVASSLFSYATKQHKAPRNPIAEVEKPDVVREEAGILTPAEMRRLLKHLPDDTVPFVVLSAFAGLRPAEVQRLEWRDVNFKTGIITVRPGTSKTKRRRTVPMKDNLRAWLRPLAKTDGNVVTLADLTIRQKRLKPARAKAKLARWPHDCLRHSAATYWLEIEKDAARVALWLGHDQEMLHEHYKGLLAQPAHALEWFAIVPRPKKTSPFHTRRELTSGVARDHTDLNQVSSTN